MTRHHLAAAAWCTLALLNTACSVGFARQDRWWWALGVALCAVLAAAYAARAITRAVGR